MTDHHHHPIAPPPELVQQWVAEIWHEGTPVQFALSDEHIATRAAQWGADQELEACCMWITREKSVLIAEELGIVRRPEPPNLNSIALQMLGTIERDAHYIPEITDTIRRALEALDD